MIFLTIMIIMVMVLMTIVTLPPVATTFNFRKNRDLEEPSHDHEEDIIINQNKWY